MMFVYCKTIVFIFQIWLLIMLLLIGANSVFVALNSVLLHLCKAEEDNYAV